MADKIERTEVTAIKVTHHFYCDFCGKHLGTVGEDDDGYYPILGDRSVKTHLPIGGWYEFRRQLCDRCWEEWLSTLRDKLRELGFRGEGNG